MIWVSQASQRATGYLLKLKKIDLTTEEFFLGCDHTGKYGRNAAYLLLFLCRSEDDSGTNFVSLDLSKVTIRVGIVSIVDEGIEQNLLHLYTAHLSIWTLILHHENRNIVKNCLFIFICKYFIVILSPLLDTNVSRWPSNPDNGCFGKMEKGVSFVMGIFKRV